MGKRAPRTPSIVGWFSPLPELPYAAGSVVLPTCPLAHAAARALSGVRRGGARNDRTLATTRDEPGGMEPAGRWPRCDAPAQPPDDGRSDSPLDEGGVQPSREAHSLQSEREISLCPQAHHVRDASELTPPVAFFHLAIDQACRYLPLACFPPSTIQREPVAKMGRQRIKVQV